VTPARILGQYMGRETGITRGRDGNVHFGDRTVGCVGMVSMLPDMMLVATGMAMALDRKSTRLNSSHLVISYAVFCLKKKMELLQADADGHNSRHINNFGCDSFEAFYRLDGPTLLVAPTKNGRARRRCALCLTPADGS